MVSNPAGCCGTGRGRESTCFLNGHLKSFQGIRVIGPWPFKENLSLTQVYVLAHHTHTQAPNHYRVRSADYTISKRIINMGWGFLWVSPREIPRRPYIFSCRGLVGGTQLPSGPRLLPHGEKGGGIVPMGAASSWRSVSGHMVLSQGAQTTVRIAKTNMPDTDPTLL